MPFEYDHHAPYQLSTFNGYHNKKIKDRTLKMQLTYRPPYIVHNPAV
jgi:hypothetical protein